MFILLLVLVFALQVAATILLSKTDLYDRKQKRSQYQLIWLVPIIGATLVLSILREETQALQRYGNVQKQDKDDA